jgi:para-aminobenzoate synthetase component 1
VARGAGAPGGLLPAFERLRADAFPWLLESSLAEGRLGRFSFGGADPYLVMRAHGRRCQIECRRAVHPGLEPGRREIDADPFELLRVLLPPAPEFPGAVSLPFAAGAVGYLGYELAEHIEPLGLAARDDLGFPDLVLLFVDRLLAYDHASGALQAIGLGFARDESRARERAQQAADELARRVDRPDRVTGSGVGIPRRESAVGPPPASFDQSAYAKAMDTVVEEIAAGNLYQGCLTRRIERRFSGEPWDLYRQLRRTNPAPFACYFQLPEVAIAGCSPERFLKLSPDGQVESRPIKGTRPREAEADLDRQRRRELEGSEKDRAENLMIVDLVRNDLGRVCEIGSVHVDDLFSIEAYASVFQMVSTVRGRLRRDRDAVDLVRASFPPGSMTGAPKIAAMRILDRLEPVRRGIYSGAIGYFDVRGGMDLSVVIRTVLLRDGRAWVHTGGGIVADSVPEDEWRETQDKARPLLAALSEN